MRVFDQLKNEYKPEGRVLEVGCGKNPAPESTVCLDPEPANIAFLRAQGREAIEGSGLELPFADKSFDYATCMHVAEHMEGHEIVKLFNEMSRVAPKGYIEVPSVYWELLHNGDKGMCSLEGDHDAPHKQYCFLHNGVLYFIRKDDVFNPLHKVLSQLFASVIKDAVIYDYPTLFMIGMGWKGSIPVKIYDSISQVPQEIFDAMSDQITKYMVGKPKPSQSKVMLRKLYLRFLKKIHLKR